MSLSNTQQKSVLIVFAVLFIFVFLVVSQFNPNPKFPSSPDGVANITFAEIISKGQYPEIIIGDDIPDDLKPFLIPRSTVFNSERSSLQLMSFYGWPVLMSGITAIVGYWISYVVVVLLGALATYGILLLLKIKKRLALIGSLLFLFNPIIIYYAPLGHMHNVLYLVLFLCSTWTLLYSIKNRHTWFYTISGVLFGFAVATRTNEVIWMSLLLLFLVIYNWKETSYKWKDAFAWLSGAIAAFLPFLLYIYNNSGSVTQYKNVSGDALSSNLSFYSTIKSYIFPFGFDIGLSFNSFYNFSLDIWWVTFPMLAGLMYLFIKLMRLNKKKELYFLLGVVVLGVYLIFYYGPTSKVYTDDLRIDLSHYRYLLPVFSLFPLTILAFLSERSIQKYLSYALIVVICALSFNFAINSKAGLSNYRTQNIIAKQKNSEIISLTEINAIILAGKADKNIFPDRVVSGEVMHRYRQDFVETLTSSSVLRPVYYYFVEANISSHWTKEALENAGVTFEYVAQFHDGGNAWEYLYKLDWPNKNKNND